MKSILTKRSLAVRILFLVTFLTVLPCLGQSETANNESCLNRETDDQDKAYKLHLYAETGLEYTDNVFRLTDSQISRMKAKDYEDVVSRRYKDMDSVSDYIVEPEIGLKFGCDNPLGGKFGLKSWLKYNYYTQNEEKSFPEGGIKLKNTIGEKGVLILGGKFLSGFFKKNYLSDVDDADDDGNIPREERIYSSATYDEYEGIIAYEYVIVKAKSNTISGFDIYPFAGYRSRIYNSTFDNRDQDIGLLGLGIRLEFISRINLNMIYQYENVASPGYQELVLYNEYVSGTDVNGDGVIKKNAPLITSVDRSSNRHTLEFNSTLKLTKRFTLSLGYKNRWTSYTSDNPLDIDHYENDAHRQEIKSGISYDFSKTWSAKFEYNRTDDHDNEDGDYSQNNYLFTIRYNFI